MKKDKAPTMIDENKPEPVSTTRPALKLDVERYEEMLNDCDLTEEQRQEFLETIWSIIVGFVDLGFDIHPLQQADPDGCGQDLDLSLFMAENVISSKKGIPKKQFTDAADCPVETQEAKGRES
ncbi:MAG: hypothetical protein L3J13_01510 [Devosiaceae bacterium]|nr:hypothetical protein [Devosiaceae bacterium]